MMIYSVLINIILSVTGSTIGIIVSLLNFKIKRKIVPLDNMRWMVNQRLSIMRSLNIENASTISSAIEI